MCLSGRGLLVGSDVPSRRGLVVAVMCLSIRGLVVPENLMLFCGGCIVQN
jgi:hypothetical protein